MLRIHRDELHKNYFDKYGGGTGIRTLEGD